MVKNSTGGNKAKKMKKGGSNMTERTLELKDNEDPSQEYCQISKALGNGRYEAKFFDGHIRMAHAAGRLKRKKIFVNTGDVVVVSLREFQDDKCDIIYVYKQTEIKQLKKLGQIPMDVSEESAEQKEVDTGFDFEEKEEEDEVGTQPNRNLDDIDFDAI
jgi:translation initiation factor 1A